MELVFDHWCEMVDLRKGIPPMQSLRDYECLLVESLPKLPELRQRRDIRLGALVSAIETTPNAYSTKEERCHWTRVALKRYREKYADGWLPPDELVWITEACAVACRWWASIQKTRPTVQWITSLKAEAESERTTERAA